MRRALIATAGTVVGLVFLLGYKAGGPVKGQKVATVGGEGAAATTTTSPTATGPTATGPTATGSAPRIYTGQEISYNYGSITVAVTVKGTRIASVAVPENFATDPHSQLINSEAVPVLEQEAVSAQGLNFDVVSGATFTSDAFAQSLQSALQKARK